MKKTLKIIGIISAVFILLFLVFVLITLIKSLSYTGPYPYPSIAGTINNWMDRFIVGVGIFSPFYSVPLIASVVLFIISLVKGRKVKNNVAV